MSLRQDEDNRIASISLISHPVQHSFLGDDPPLPSSRCHLTRIIIHHCNATHPIKSYPPSMIYYRTVSLPLTLSLPVPYLLPLFAYTLSFSLIPVSFHLPSPLSLFVLYLPVILHFLLLPTLSLLPFSNSPSLPSSLHNTLPLTLPLGVPLIHVPKK